jgi:hypothetical protein
LVIVTRPPPRLGDRPERRGHPPWLPSALEPHRFKRRGVDITAKPRTNDARIARERRFNTAAGSRRVHRPREVEHQLAIVACHDHPQTAVLPNLATAGDRNRRVPRSLVDLTVSDSRGHDGASVSP